MQVRVYYEDTDAAGVVYHSNYLNFFERARTEYFRDRGFSVGKLHEEGYIFPVVRAEVDFRAPAKHDDLLRIETSVVTIGKTSFCLAQRAVREEDGKLLVEGKITLACIGHNLRAKRLPDFLLKVMTEE